MTDPAQAPERIWTRGRDGETEMGLFVTVPATHGYVREDLFAAQQATIDDLVAALTKIAHLDQPDYDFGDDGWIEDIDTARAALSRAKTPTNEKRAPPSD